MHTHFSDQKYVFSVVSISQKQLYTYKRQETITWYLSEKGLGRPWTFTIIHTTWYYHQLQNISQITQTSRQNIW